MEKMKVLEAINQVQAAMAVMGIKKDSKNAAQGYNFRGIDSVFNEFAPVLAKAKLIVVPSYSERVCVEREGRNGGALFYVTVRGDFTFRSAEDGSEVKAGPFYGEAMDSGDKATNKAMSAAMKYAFLQTFTVPTEGDNDADAHTHEVVAKVGKITPTTGAWESQTPYMQDALTQLATEVTNMVASGSVAAAVDAIEDKESSWWLDEMCKVAFWSRLDSKTRSSIKKAKDLAAMDAAVQRQRNKEAA